MVKREIQQRIWGGMIWGDCIGRVHKGWSASAMDSTFGTAFFADLVTANTEFLAWPEALRSVEPVQRRAYVELGLYGHTIQLALLTESILCASSGQSLQMGYESAMNDDAFRTPNSELLETMFRLCRGETVVDERYTLLFLPTIVYLALSEIGRRKPEDLLPLVSFYSTVRKMLIMIRESPFLGDAMQRLIETLDNTFMVSDRGNSVGLGSFEQIYERSETPMNFWKSSRELLRSVPYAGATLGLLSVARFGGEAFLPWHHIEKPLKLSTLAGNSPRSVQAFVEAEAELSSREALCRDEILAERRAELPVAYA